jgi:hypothetical protein
MEQFMQASQRDGNCFKCLCSKFPGLSEAELKEGIFVGPDIIKLISDEMFEKTMSSVEREAWIVLKDVISKFLGNYSDQNYKKHHKAHARQIQRIGLQHEPESSFLASHLDCFSANLGAISEEEGERLHQDIREMERRYQGRWNVSIMTYYCWIWQQEVPEGLHIRKSMKRSFESKRLRFHKKSVHAE